jgi:hypothetical protein
MAAVVIVTLAGERFVGLVAENLAQVGDRDADPGNPHCSWGIEREACDGGRRFALGRAW